VRWPSLPPTLRPMAAGIRARTGASSASSVFRDRLGCDVGELRITVDPVACEAYGYCAELLPEAVSLDEWGYPIVNDLRLTADFTALAKRAARACPKRAITLRVRFG
jgi:ferredoxin